MNRSVVSGRGRHMSSSTFLGANFYACYGEYAQQYVADRRMSRQKDSSPMGSVAAVETAQIQLHLKKLEFRRAFSSERQQRLTSKETDDRTIRSFPSALDGNNPNPRVIIVHPAKQVIRMSRPPTLSMFKVSDTANSAMSEGSNSFDFDESSARPNMNSKDEADRDKHMKSTAGSAFDASHHCPNTRLRSLSELLWQGFAIDDIVYCGALDASQNSAILCRLNIEYLVDLSGLDDKYFKCQRNECPCPCSRTNAHTRMVMTINIVEEDSELSAKQDLIACFGDFISLVNKARARHKCVLVFSRDGRNRAPAFSAAYLMHEYRYTRITAVKKVAELVPKTRPGICISDTLQRALMRWQRVLGICRSTDSIKQCITKPASIPSPFVVKRTAWM